MTTKICTFTVFAVHSVCIHHSFCLLLNHVPFGYPFFLLNYFMLDRPASSCVIFFQCLFGRSIATIKMGKSTRSRLDASASLSLLQYWCVCSLLAVIHCCHLCCMATLMVLGHCHAVLPLDCCVASIGLLCLQHISLAVFFLLPWSCHFAVAFLLCPVTLLHHNCSALP